MIRIYADFNSTDEHGRVLLNTVGSREDLERHKNQLAEGQTILLYMTGEFTVVGILTFDGIWMGVPDWDTIRYETSEDSQE